MKAESSTTGRCLSNVWRVQIERSLHKHYAPYPLALCERPIAMTCPMNICAKCGFIRTRRVEKQCYDEPSKGRNSRIFGKYTSDTAANLVEITTRRDAGRHYVARMPVTTGWDECACKEWERGIVLDPFAGSGTTGEVALKMGRSFIGIDLYAKHADMAEQRCAATMEWLLSNKLDAGRLEQ
jgi:DNA modification methylase